MKTKTIYGTTVEIIGLNGNNMVTVNVTGRNESAQVNAVDLHKPEGTIPEELAELKFFDPEEAAKKKSGVAAENPTGGDEQLEKSPIA